MNDRLPLQITTPRLILREPRESDFPALLAIFSVAEIHRYERPIPTPAEIDLMLHQSIESAADSPRIRFKPVIVHRVDGSLCGVLSLTLNNPEIKEWEIGWVVRREDWGKGIAPEAAITLLEFAFDVLGAHRVIAFCHAENRQSVRVMEKNRDAVRRFASENSLAERRLAQ